MPWRFWRSRPVLSGVEARQGFLDGPVLIVLTVSVALVVAAFAIVWAVS